MRGFASRVRHAGSAVAAAVAIALAVSGCASTQPGDKNPGSGYTNNVTDLVVKIPALVTDPCGGTQADRLFPDCGRFVTEVANTVAALRADLPGQSDAINALSDAVNRYQRAGCDSLDGAPSASQRTTCPSALRAIGSELDKLSSALSTIPTGG